MTDYQERSSWMLAAGAVVLAAVAGVVAYNVGVSHGLAQGAIAQGTPGAYGWGYRPFGFGFGFPFFFLLVWVLLFRGLFWGGPWRRRWYYGAPDTPGAFEDWHRRAHERMKEAPSADDPRGGR
jgi:hypothetical protein